MPATIKPGRPTEADKRHIAQVALELFEQKGFDAVTMEEVAKAASVSRRTLFRHFPSKSDLVWAGTDDILGVLRSLAAPLEGRNVGLASIVDEMFVPILVTLDDPAAEDLARRRLRLVAGAPTLLNHHTLQEIERLIAAIVASSALPKDTPAPLVARSLVAATFAALQWWAEHGRGMRALDTTLGAWKAIAIALDRSR